MSHRLSILLILLAVFPTSVYSQTDSLLFQKVKAAQPEQFSFDIQDFLIMEKALGIEKYKKASRKAKKIVNSVADAYPVKETYSSDDAILFFNLVNEVRKEYG